MSNTCAASAGAKSPITTWKDMQIPIRNNIMQSSTASLPRTPNTWKAGGNKGFVTYKYTHTHAHTHDKNTRGQEKKLKIITGKRDIKTSLTSHIEA